LLELVILDRAQDKGRLVKYRWEKRLLHFLELSGIGRVMEDEEEARAERMDGLLLHLPSLSLCPTAPGNEGDAFPIWS
jgi:hypothetical protein